MKTYSLLLLFVPVFASAAEMSLAKNMSGLPDGFRKYFYESEVMTQIYLNGTYLFDANISLKENGDINLISIVEEPQDGDAELRQHWRQILKEGVHAGKCTTSCPSGLMAVEYLLNNSTLNLYTAKYEKQQVKSSYIALPEDTPNGFIMSNDVTAAGTGDAHSWGLNSSLTSSLAGWSQKASFQSSGTSGHNNYSSSSLYELFSQKELNGSFLRLGLFAPDSDTGNVQTAGYGYDTVAGAMWGTSDALLVSSESVSARPVYVTGRNQSIAEVWRDGRLIYTQELQSGVQALDTRKLPMGIYDISIKIIESGQTVDTQLAQIYKPQGWSNPDQRVRMNFWSGQHRTIASGDAYTRDDNPFAVGGGVDFLAHPRLVMGLSGAATEDDQQGRVRANYTLSPNDTLFAQYSAGNNQYRSSANTDIRYYRNLPSAGSASLFWRSTTTDVYGHKTTSRQSGDTYGSTLSLRLPHSTSLIVNSQYMDTAWRKGFGADLSVTNLANIAGRDMNFRVSGYDRPGFGNHDRDQGISLGVSISLAPAARHTFSAETGLNQNKGYTSANYQWHPGDDSSIRYLGAGVSYSKDNTVLSGNGAIDTPYASGDFFAQHNTQGSNNTAGANLSQVLLIGGGKVASVNGSRNRGMESAVIVDVDSDDEDAKIVASGSMAENRLVPGRNVIPAELWKKDHIQFSSRDGQSLQVFPERQSVQMNRGSVQYVKVKAVKTFTVVGMLKDQYGKALKNRYVSSDVSGAMINAEGVLTLDSGVKNRLLKVKSEAGQPSLQCLLPADMAPDMKVQFVSAVPCSVATEEGK